MKTSTSPEQLSLLAQSDLLLLLAEPLRPQRVSRDGATRGAFAASNGALRSVTEDEVEDLLSHAGLRDTEHAEALIQAVRAVRATPCDVLREEHARLFDAAGLCPPNETVYIRRDKGAILADIVGFYTAFGFELSPEGGEKADHVAAELEFVALLLFLTARAIDRETREAEEISRSALHAFVRDHLGDWLPAFCLRLEAAAAFPAYRRIAIALRCVWEEILRCHAIRLDEPAWTDHGPDPDPGSPYECDRS